MEQICKTKGIGVKHELGTWHSSDKPQKDNLPANTSEPPLSINDGQPWICNVSFAVKKVAHR